MVLDLLEDLLFHLELPFVRLDGSVAREKRDDAIRKFQEADDGAPRVFLLSTRAGGTGLNLQAADTVILFDSDYNPQMDLQAQARAHRFGQER